MADGNLPKRRKKGRAVDKLFKDAIYPFYDNSQWSNPARIAESAPDPPEMDESQPLQWSEQSDSATADVCSVLVIPLQAQPLFITEDEEQLESIMLATSGEVDEEDSENEAFLSTGHEGPDPELNHLETEEAEDNKTSSPERQA